MKLELLLVTCCLEQTRYDLLKEVVENLECSLDQIENYNLTIFDNASTIEATIPLLTTYFNNVYQSSVNVGYWSSISWWLDHIKTKNVDYTYIIESDMMHYHMYLLNHCVSFLDNNQEIGSIRLHEYSIKDWHLYNKDHPVKESKRNLWQSHTNRVTGEKITLLKTNNDLIWETNFLTQLPALNRYKTMSEIFDKLKTLDSFTEPDFQLLYHEKFPKTAILDGGIFNCDLNPYGTKIITGSWTDQNKLKDLGYKATRIGNIVSKSKYNVTKLA
jgi:hypothetical protein